MLGTPAIRDLNQQHRSLLVVVYYFPPWGGGPVLRTLKFVKYLARLGWRIRVLTADPAYYEPVAYDPRLLEEIEPGTRLEQTRSLQPRGALARGLVAAATGAGRPAWLLRRLMPLARLVHGLLVPDDKVLWVPFALGRGLRLIREEPPDVIFVSAPPHSSTLLGLALSRCARRPLVVDFRDDWVANPLYRRGRPRGAIEARLETAVAAGSAALVVPTPTSAQRLRARYPCRSQRVHLVPNGFDEDDLDRARELLSQLVQTSPALTCVYAGLLTQRRDLGPLLLAMQRIQQRAPGSVRLVLAGFVPRAVARRVTELGLVEQVEYLGYVSHLDALAHIMRADVAVLLSTEAEGAATAVPSKLYEYVASGTYVLGLVDPGATRDLIVQHHWGAVCAPDDAEAIEQALLDLCARKQHGTLQLTVDARQRVAAYSRRPQSELLSHILAEVAASRGGAYAER